jgi:hypothetical protein
VFTCLSRVVVATLCMAGAGRYEVDHPSWMEAGPQPRGKECRLDGLPAAVDDLAMRATQRVIAAIGVAGLLARLAYPRGFGTT